jgi:chromosome segregation ATPase
MTTKNPEARPEEGALVINYETTLGAIAQLAEQYKGLTFDTPEDYERGRKAIADLRERRVKVEKRRKELKRDSLEFGRKVDAAADELKSAIEAIEDPLLAARKAVDDAEAERKRQEEKAELFRLNAELTAKREAEEKAAADKRAAEEAKLAEERKRLEEATAKQKAEADRLAAQQVEIDRQKAELAQQQAAADAATKANQVQREALDRQAQTPVVAVDNVAATVAAAAAPAVDISATAEEPARTDAEQVRHFAARIRGLMDDAPKLEGKAGEAIAWAVTRLEKTADTLILFREPA